ncbi:MAG TPA: serine hydrolase [Thermomicrobiales bacterium]|jgi:D-alanyl-D-alanine carboxypeptidase (penicillin-binding protein 5/6)|nr:serine hydrolase [Thermomicrobiales bacterium]
MRTFHEAISSAHRIHRRRLIGGAATGLLLAALPLGRLAHPGDAANQGPSTVAGQQQPDEVALAERWVVPDDLPLPPDVTAASLFVGAIESGRVLLARNATIGRAPASTIKIAIALTVVDVLSDPDQSVVVEPEDEVDRWVYSNAQLEAGDRITIRDLLYGLLLPSGNDAARTLARVGGLTLDPDSDDPTATFLDTVNGKVASLGATATTVLHPAGVDTDGQVTTARDLALLMAALLDDELLASIVGTYDYEMNVAGPAARTVLLTNTNQLLGSAGILGGKTGTTEAAGACLVTAVLSASGERVITVVMGCDQEVDADGLLVADHRYDDTRALIQATVAPEPLSSMAPPPIVDPVPA